MKEITSTMSDSGTLKTLPRTLRAPHRFIGAQELMSITVNSHTGFLSKRGRRERIVERFNLPNKAFFDEIKKWRKRFVIISQGCVYIFDKEVSRRPHQSFSLAGYNRLSKMGSDHNAFPFRLEGKTGSGLKEYHFSSVSEEERKKWMLKFREEMCIANDKEPDTRPLSLTDEDAYIYLQTPVFEPDNVDDDDDTNSDASSNYDKIPEDIIHEHKRPLPPTPEAESTTRTLPNPPRDIRKSPKPRRASEDRGRRAIPPIPEYDDKTSGGQTDKTSGGQVNKTALKPSKKKPEPQEPVSKPKAIPRNVTKGREDGLPKEKDYMYDGSDREEVRRLLIQGPDGTFLVRKSRNDESKVLAVKSDDEIREYKIFKQDSKITLDKKTYYNSMQDLVKNYSKMNLPKRDTHLGKAYSNLDLNNI